MLHYFRVLPSACCRIIIRQLQRNGNFDEISVESMIVNGDGKFDVMFFYGIGDFDGSLESNSNIDIFVWRGISISVNFGHMEGTVLKKLNSMEPETITARSLLLPFLKFYTIRKSMDMLSRFSII